jgi:ATP-dependent Lon protease
MTTIRRANERLEVDDDLAVVALRDLVFFPYLVLPLLIGRAASLAALDEARRGSGRVLLLAQRDASIDTPEADDLNRVGTVAQIVETTPLPDGTSRVMFEGLGRARVIEFTGGRGASVSRARIEAFVAAECDDPAVPDLGAAGPMQPDRSPTDDAQWRTVARYFAEYCDLHERMADGLARTIVEGPDRTRAAHLIAGHMLLSPADKQAVLECPDLSAMLETLQRLLARELEVLHIEKKLEQQVHLRMDGNRRQHYLREQLRAIRQELGDDEGDDWADLEAALAEAGVPEPVELRARRELDRLRRLNPVAPEAGVIRGWLEWIAALPWHARSNEAVDVAQAEAILEADHHGLAEVKDRILDQIGVFAQVGRTTGPVLCLVGPPGVGKTSLARSIARALGREFVRVSLGGVRDEAEIRGHRRTYVGALPGRIVQGMRRAGTRNPLFLLDEIDKLAQDRLGDPGAALLEVLDPEQNGAFTDHYLEVDYDLSDVLFIATANSLSDIPAALRDRMEVIRLPGYLDTEKRGIAERFLWPRQARAHGLDPERVTLAPGVIAAVIGDYTREAGVRELTRRLARLARKLAREAATQGAGGSVSGGAGEARRSEGSVSGDGAAVPGSGRRAWTRHVVPADLPGLLGPAAQRDEAPDSDPDRVGIAQGLAWTAAGGQVLDVEVAVVPGTGEVRLTGTLGDVMKESALAALTWARSRSARLGLDERFHEQVDVHVHIPEGATPKDGPSAGITMAVALISALTGIPTAPALALTGEVTLRGRVLAVGGIREKAVAALRQGLRTVVIPAGNRADLERLPDEVRDGLEFVLVHSMDEVLIPSLVRSPVPRPTPSTARLGDELAAPHPSPQ